MRDVIAFLMETKSFEVMLRSPEEKVNLFWMIQLFLDEGQLRVVLDED